MKRFILAIASCFALTGVSHGAWKKAAGGADYPTNSSPASGDALLLWDAGTGTTNNLFLGTLQSTWFGSPGAIGGVTPGSGAFTTISSSGAATLNSLVLQGNATFTDNIRLTFNPGADAAGINVGAVTSDPGTLVNGDIWYNSTTGVFKIRAGGTTLSLGAAFDPGSPGVIGGDVPDGASFTSLTLSSTIGFADNVRITFNPGAANPGINVGSYAGDPTTPINGDLWYDSVANELTARINGASVALGAGGGGGSVATDTIWDAAGDLVYGTGSNTASRLALGTAGQLLHVNSGATAPEWTSTPTVTTLNATTGNVGSLVFEGSTVDANETTVDVTDPTADRTITLPNNTGTVILGAAAVAQTIDLGGDTSFEIPNGASPTTDAFGEIAGDNDAWAASRGALEFFDGTASTNLVGVLASDTPSNGQVPKWNTGGTITWETDNSTAGGGLTYTDLAGGTSLSVNTDYGDTFAANRTFSALPAGADGDVIVLTFDVTGATRTLDFHTNSTVYRIGASGALAAGLDFPVGNHSIVLNKSDSKWFIQDSVTASSGTFDEAGDFVLTGDWDFSGATVTLPPLVVTDLNTTNLTFEGSTADANETTLTVVDPTADRTVTIPNDSGTMAYAEIVTKSTAANYTIGTTNPRELYGGVIYVTAAATITIPAVAAGASFTVITIGANAVSVDPNAADLIYLDGTALSDGDKVTNTSTAGDIAVFTYLDGTGWYCSSNSWTDGN